MTKLVLEIRNIRDMEILLPLLKRLRIPYVRMEDPAKKESEKEAAAYDFSDLAGKLEWDGNAVFEQRRLRDEW